MNKIIKLFIFVCFFFLFNSPAIAVICDLGRDPGTCVGYDTGTYVDHSYCTPGTSLICAKGNDCPYGICFSDSGCCTEGVQAWTAYETKCVEVITLFSKLHIPVYAEKKEMYSIGDKANPNSIYVMRGSDCFGEPTGPYKACCNTSTGVLTPYSTMNLDNKSPLEAGCGYDTEISATTYDQAYETCRQYNLCKNDCLTPPSSGTCSGLNSSTYVYTNGTGLCAAGQICCSKTAVVPTSTQPACTMDSQCEDNNMCTSNICKNPGTASAKCDFPLNTLCVRYYCNNTSHTCSATSNTYNADAAGTALCQSNLGTIYPGQTTGVCYPKESDCISVCSVGPTTTPTTTTTQCVPFNCTRRDGECGSANNNTYTSSVTLTYSYPLCSSGTASGLTNYYGDWRWTCDGDGSKP